MKFLAQFHWLCTQWIPHSQVLHIGLHIELSCANGIWVFWIVKQCCFLFLFLMWHLMVLLTLRWKIHSSVNKSKYNITSVYIFSWDWLQQLIVRIGWLFMANWIHAALHWTKIWYLVLLYNFQKIILASDSLTKRVDWEKESIHFESNRNNTFILAAFAVCCLHYSFIKAILHCKYIQ